MTLSYWVEPGGKIIRISGPWDAWLGQDGAISERCAKMNVLGSSLFSFIDNAGVKHVYRTLQKRVSESGQAIEFPYRCDSPRLKREMQMTITRDRDIVRYDSKLLKEERRSWPLPRTEPGTGALIAMCSFCQAYRFPVESKSWKDLDQIFQELHLPPVFSVSHSFCPACYERAVGQISAV